MANDCRKRACQADASGQGEGRSHKRQGDAETRRCLLSAIHMDGQQEEQIFEQNLKNVQGILRKKQMELVEQQPEEPAVQELNDEERAGDGTTATTNRNHNGGFELLNFQQRRDVISQLVDDYNVGIADIQRRMNIMEEELLNKLVDVGSFQRDGIKETVTNPAKDTKKARKTKKSRPLAREVTKRARRSEGK